jgi:hypothetical protein
MGWACSMHERDEKWSATNPNIKSYWLGRCGFICLRLDTRGSLFEHGNESSVSVNTEEFLHRGAIHS